MKNIILIVISLFLLSSCEKNDDDNLCATTSPPPDFITISIVDNEGNSLIGLNNTYKPSDISLIRGNQYIPLRFYEYDEIIFMEFDYYEMSSEKDYELKLNEQETDILNLKINRYNTDCFLYLKSVEKFVYNEIEIQSNSGFYEIRK